jgi:small-conductance mechanosensitive channel
MSAAAAAAPDRPATPEPSKRRPLVRILIACALLAVALLAATTIAQQQEAPAGPALPSDGDVLAQRLEVSRNELAAARTEHDRLELIYQRERVGAANATADKPLDPELRPPDESAVARMIDELAAQTNFVAQFEEHADLRRLDDAIGAARATASASERADLDKRSALVAELRRVRADLFTLRRQTLARLRSENLFLQGSTHISRDALEQGIADLGRLPGWLAEQAARLPAWIEAPGDVRSLFGFLAALLPLALAVAFARRWTARHIARLSQLDLSAMPVRTTLLLANLLRIACTAAFLWLAPLLATLLIRGLPEVADEILTGLGAITALFWVGLGVNRELLRPTPPTRSVLRVDATTATRVSRGVTFLLWWSLIAVCVRHLLTRLVYDNDGALEAIELVHKVVVGAIVMFVLFRRALLMSLLPSTERPLGRFLHRIAGLLHTTLVLLVPTVVVLHLLRFRLLAGFLTSGAIVVLAAFPFGSIVYHSLLFFVTRSRARATERAGDDEAATRRIEAIDEAVRFLLRGFVIVLVISAVFAATESSLADVRTFLDRALPLQNPGPGQAAVTWWNLALAALIAFVVLRSARHVHMVLERLVLPSTRLAHATQYTITTVADYLLIGLGLWLAVSQIVDIRSLGYLVAALSVGIGFGLQEIISNFVSGLILLFERPLKPGDLVEIGAGTLGTVRKLGIRATTVRTGDNVHILVPNREFITQRVVNYDLLDPRVRVTISIGVAYSCDPRQVRDALLEVAAHDKRLLKRPAPEVLFTDFGDSSLNFKLLVWIENAHDQFRIASDLRFAIDTSFRRLGIEIPFPQRDVALKSAQPLRVVVERAAAADEPRKPSPEK